MVLVCICHHNFPGILEGKDDDFSSWITAHRRLGNNINTGRGFLSRGYGVVLTLIVGCRRFMDPALAL